MKHLILFTFLINSVVALAVEKESEWTATSLSDSVIEKIQGAQIQYKQCVSKEMQKQGYAKIESRSATEAITKQCEKVLSNMRKVYLDAKVPEVIADRHLKKLRIDITRRVLKQLMFVNAAKKAGK